MKIWILEIVVIPLLDYVESRNSNQPIICWRISCLAPKFIERTFVPEILDHFHFEASTDNLFSLFWDFTFIVLNSFHIYFLCFNSKRILMLFKRKLLCWGYLYISDNCSAIVLCFIFFRTTLFQFYSIFCRQSGFRSVLPAFMSITTASFGFNMQMESKSCRIFYFLVRPQAFYPFTFSRSVFWSKLWNEFWNCFFE